MVIVGNSTCCCHFALFAPPPRPTGPWTRLANASSSYCFAYCLGFLHTFFMSFTIKKKRRRIKWNKNDSSVLNFLTRKLNCHVGLEGQAPHYSLENFSVHSFSVLQWFLLAFNLICAFFVFYLASCGLAICRLLISPVEKAVEAKFCCRFFGSLFWHFDIL